MNGYQTQRYAQNVQNQATGDSQLSLTIFDESRPPYTISLDAFHKDQVVFGRGASNDINLSSQLVSGHPSHGRFVKINGQWRIEDLNSTNGLVCNNAFIRARTVHEGDLIRIAPRKPSNDSGVLFLVSSVKSKVIWKRVPLSRNIVIGRDTSCDIVLPNVSVSKRHAGIRWINGRWYLEDLQSLNGVVLNNTQVKARVALQEKDVISIINTRMIFTSAAIYYNYSVEGISLDVSDVVIKRGNTVTGNHISVSINPGELVAIVGGSGAGKSTLLNCMCGYLRPAEGKVSINGVDLYQNFDAMKRTFGYVPQADIVYDNLTLWDMLMYTAKLRLPKDISPAERERAIIKAIQTVDLWDRKDHLIRKLSGGQRKRASIAVELLSDPNLLFLDEPASGLDPGTERNLMQSLRKMADAGKTVVLVTHSTLQLSMCDKIIFMGKGGNLCYYGTYQSALQFFGVTDVVDIYEPITNNALGFKAKYDAMTPAVVPQPTGSVPRVKNDLGLRQVFPLCGRYLRLIVNDRQRLCLLMVQAPLLALLISFVADGKQFEQYEMTKSLLFALSCSAFWIGMLNSIQEICKERVILKREYMAGVSLSMYLLSKLLVLGLLCLVQSLLVSGVFSLLIGVPERGVILGAYPEILLITYLTAVASSATGLFVSALFTNADRAMTVAPILLMPQILFSGLIFNLEGFTKNLSWFAVCRWSMEGYGTTANLNNLPKRMEQEGFMLPHVAEDFFTYTAEHFMQACLILLIYTLISLILARVALTKLKNE